MDKRAQHYQEQARLAKMERLLRRMLDPEDLGHAVTGEVRDEARILLGMPAVESRLKSSDPFPTLKVPDEV